MKIGWEKIPLWTFSSLHGSYKLYMAFYFVLRQKNIISTLFGACVFDNLTAMVWAYLESEIYIFDKMKLFYHFSYIKHIASLSCVYVNSIARKWKALFDVKKII